jgi:hypothetical protein
MMAILAADFFLSEVYSKQLWLLLAIGPALLAVATRRVTEEQEADEVPEEPPPGALAPPGPLVPVPS